MSDFDPNREWRRLSEVYAAMNEDELQAVADDAYELTDIAKQVLQAEISHRGLSIELKKQAPASEDQEPVYDDANYAPPPEEDLEELQRVWNMDEAKDIKSRLDAGSVPSYLGPESVDDIRLLRASFERGVAVKVRISDSQRAMGVLANSYRPPEGEAPADEPDDVEYEVHCPKCHSTEIVFQSLEPDPATKSAFDSKFNWSCDACGHRWKDDGMESES
jgi:DNA-directed RNA polymerase subunit M/transcription elongation factor TFIIS